MQKLRSENEQLKNRIVGLDKEISKLKETADYHYQKGVELLTASTRSTKKLEETKKEFETVMEKHPTSPLVSSAKEQLEKVSIQIAQKLDDERHRQEDEPAQRNAGLFTLKPTKPSL